MKQYFISGHFYVPKNKAHKELQDFAQTFQHCLIDEQKLNELKSAFKAKTSDVNWLNKRCQDIDLQARSFDKKNFMFIVDSNFQLTATLIERFELATTNNYLVIHRPTGTTFTLEDKRQGDMLDHIMALDDGDLGNYMVYEQWM
ncbi:hypothetical protein [Mangrovibacterium sp.]|uniref:hypothetical protein n=1 Tax=Mangrovibacterium sp. TaxID=1961364 RepID=UPI003568942C